MTNLFQAAGLEKEAPRPLADRLRPRRLAEVVGQDHLVGPEGTLTRMLKSGRLQSMILWGPPGSGKTTVARLLADETNLAFEQLSDIMAFRIVVARPRLARDSAGANPMLSASASPFSGRLSMRAAGGVPGSIIITRKPALIRP